MAAKSRASRQRERGPSRRGARGPARPPPTYFLSLTLEGAECFGPRQTLELSDGQGRPARWTLLLGENGVGKTTLLRGLAAIEPQARQGPGGMLTAELFSGHLGSQRRRGGPGEAFTVSLPPDAGRDAWRDVPPALHGLRCYGYGATRRWGAGPVKEEGGASDSLLSEEAPMRGAEAWLLGAEAAARGMRAGRSRDPLRRLLVGLLPDVTDLRRGAPTASRAEVRLEVKTPCGWVAPGELGLGQRSLLAWTVDLASRLFERYPDSPDPLAEPAVVLVDELELHLHPRWQRQLIDALTERFPRTQFIATTYSPLVVQGAPEANVAVLRREGEHVVIDNARASLRGLRVDQLLTSELFGLESARPPRLDRLLQQRTALLSKPRLSMRDRTRLTRLEADLGPLPAGETRAEREALELIQRFAQRVREERG